MNTLEQIKKNKEIKKEENRKRQERRQLLVDKINKLIKEWYSPKELWLVLKQDQSIVRRISKDKLSMSEEKVEFYLKALNK